MKNNQLLVISIILLVSVVFVLIFNQRSQVENSESSAAIDQPNVVEGNVFKLSVSKEYVYSPQVMKVKKGDKVRIEGDLSTLVGSMDTIVIDGYKVNKKVVKGDNFLEFVADKSGVFKVHCANGMGDGKLIVE